MMVVEAEHAKKVHVHSYTEQQKKQDNDLLEMIRMRELKRK